MTRNNRQQASFENMFYLHLNPIVKYRIMVSFDHT